MKLIFGIILVRVFFSFGKVTSFHDLEDGSEESKKLSVPMLDDIAEMEETLSKIMTLIEEKEEILGATYHDEKTGRKQKTLKGIVVPRKSGRDFDSAISLDDLGKGFKLNTKATESPLNRLLFLTQKSKMIANKGTYIDQRMMNNEADLSKTLDVGGEVSVGFGPVAVGAGFDYATSNASTKTSTTFLYVNRQSHFALTPMNPNNLETVQSVQNYIRDQKYEAIYEEFGTKYVSQLLYGAQLNIAITVTSETSLDSDDIAAELSTGIKAGGVSVDLSAKFAKSDTTGKSSYNMHITIESIGVNVKANTITSFGDFPQVKDVIDQFDKDYNAILIKLSELSGEEKETYLREQLTPVAITIEDTHNAIIELSQDQASALSARMNKLSEANIDLQLSMGKLMSVQTILADKFNHNPKGKGIFYYPWEDEYKAVHAILEEKLTEIENFQQDNITTIINKQISEVPQTMSREVHTRIDGLIGDGFIRSPTLTDPMSNFQKNYPDMYWEGYVLNGETFMEGTLKHEKDDRKVMNYNLIHNILDCTTCDYWEANYGEHLVDGVCPYFCKGTCGNVPLYMDGGSDCRAYPTTDDITVICTTCKDGTGFSNGMPLTNGVCTNACTWNGDCLHSKYFPYDYDCSGVV